jgi:hypothetical protein
MTTAPRFAAIEIDPDWTSPFGVLALATAALSLIVAAVVALANTNAIQSHQQATAEARLLLDDLVRRGLRRHRSIWLCGDRLGSAPRAVMSLGGFAAFRQFEASEVVRRC